MFKFVLKTSKKINSNNALLFKYSRGSGPFLGFMLSKKFGNAVKRNKFKNQCRFLYRQLLREGASLSLIVRPLENNLNFKSIEEAFKDFKKQAGCI